MAAPKKLSDEEIRAKLESLAGWQVKDGKLHRDFKFDDFGAAFGFMTRAAIVAEKMDHHPEWFNVYSRVSVDLTTHDAGGISNNDFELAEVMNKLAG